MATVDRMYALSPPAWLEETHSNFKQAADHVVAGSNAFADGLDNLSKEDMNLAFDHLGQLTRYFKFDPALRVQAQSHPPIQPGSSGLDCP